MDGQRLRTGVLPADALQQRHRVDISRLSIEQTAPTNIETETHHRWARGLAHLRLICGVIKAEGCGSHETTVRGAEGDGEAGGRSEELAGAAKIYRVKNRK